MVHATARAVAATIPRPCHGGKKEEARALRAHERRLGVAGHHQPRLAGSLQHGDDSGASRFIRERNRRTVLNNILMGRLRADRYISITTIAHDGVDAPGPRHLHRRRSALLRLDGVETADPAIGDDGRTLASIARAPPRGAASRCSTQHRNRR